MDPILSPAILGPPTLNNLYEPTVPELAPGQALQNVPRPGAPGSLHMLPSMPSMSSGMAPPSYPPTPYPATPTAVSVRPSRSDLRPRPQQVDEARARAHLHTLSASFSAMAEQLSTISHTFSNPNSASAIASVGAAALPPTIDTDAILNAIAGLRKRVESLERTHAELGDDLDELRGRMERLGTDSRTDTRSTNEDVSAAGDESIREDNRRQSKALDQQQIDVENLMGRVTEELEGRIADVMENFRVDQSRLYARLHNASCVKQKMLIKPLPMANGKTPPNFPNTKGEFEHLTKERYEGILKAYNQPVKGDTAAKREACRVFLGIPPAD